MTAKRQRLILLALLLSFALGGCVTLNDPEVSQEYRADVVAVLQDGQTAGQTLISRRARFNGLTLWLRPASEPDGGQVTLELYHRPGDLQPLAAVSVPADELARNNQYTFRFPAQPGPPGQAYYLLLKAEGRAVSVLGSLEDRYPHGQAHISGPAESDLAFRQGYEYDLNAALSDLSGWLGRLWLAIPLLLAFWLPGRLILQFSGFDRDLDWGMRLALSVGLSLSAIPLLMTWTSLLDLPWSPLAVRLGAGLLVLALLALNRRALLGLRGAGLRQVGMGLRRLATSAVGVSPALAAVFLFSLAFRLAMVRDLAGPAWVDSIHHGLITRLIVESGRFPQTYAPYIDLETANYHSGYHSTVAVFHWLSGMDLIDALLFTGQVFNALCVPAVYLFTASLTRNRYAGLAAAFITGMFTPMPVYYASWGRYTQLASLLILPPALFFIQALFDPGRRRLPALLLTAIACGGLFLTHYRVIFFLVLFIAALFAAQIAARLGSLILHALSAGRGETPAAAGAAEPGAVPASSAGGIPARGEPPQTGPLSRLPQNALLLGLAGLLSIGFTLPWWPDTLITFVIPRLTANPAAEPWFSDFSWGLLTSAYGRYTLALAGAGLLWAALRRKIFPWTLALWVGLMFLAANLSAWAPGLPGGGQINNTSVEILLFIPISALGGFLVAEALQAWATVFPGRWRPAFLALLAAGGAALAVIGARSLMPILNPVTLLIRQADRPALAWMAENLPPGSAVAINPFNWGYGAYAGQDGGYWIPAVTPHYTLPPPVLYGFSSSGEKILDTTAAARRVTELAGDPGQLHAFLKSRGIDYVYLGARGGVLSPRALLQSPLYETLYACDGVYLFYLPDAP